MPTTSSEQKRARACGTWPSPLTVDVLTAARRLAFPTLHEGRVFWMEGRPSEGGRNVLMCAAADGHGAATELAPAPFNVRSRVHEYGGQAYVCEGDRVWFIDDSSQRVMEVRGTAEPRAVSAPPCRLADLAYDGARSRLIAVSEWHDKRGEEPANAIVSIDLATGAVLRLCEGHGFFAAPRMDRQGKWLAYLTWDHPDMPWDAAALRVAPVSDDGSVGLAVHVAGDRRASAFGPCWSPGGTLAFAWERDGHWNLFAWRPGGEVTRLLPPQAAEYALPLWQLGMSTFGWVDDNTLMAAFVAEGRWQVGVVDVRSGSLRIVKNDWPAVAHLHATQGGAAIIAAAPQLPSSVARVGANGECTIVRSSFGLSADLQTCIAVPEAVTFETSGGQTAHAFFYAPTHARFAPLPAELPPLLVMAHGGPTAATTAAWNAIIQYWTSRGFAVVDVNYRGSTGFGRAFREQLDGQWGVADVEDCVFAARHLAARGLVDGRRMAIRGSSAGGFTALAALSHGTFAAGAVHYGVADLEALVRDTHKFEARYLDRLIGPHPARADVYRARSPLHAACAIAVPVIFFQGLEDKVVPPNQTQAMVDALRARGVPAECHMFEGEQHGFRKAETLRQVYDAELSFYGRVFGFAPSGDESR